MAAIRIVPLEVLHREGVTIPYWFSIDFIPHLILGSGMEIKLRQHQ
jgi:hypothetical protein